MRDFMRHHPGEFVIRADKPHRSGRDTDMPSIGDPIDPITLNQLNRELAGGDRPQVQGMGAPPPYDVELEGLNTSHRHPPYQLRPLFGSNSINRPLVDPD